MNLFQKGLLAFTVVILVVVITVAALAGYSTETEFRRYAATSNQRTLRLMDSLVAYYRQQGDWAGLQQVFAGLVESPGGYGRQDGTIGQGSVAAQGVRDIVYRVADVERWILATTEGELQGRLSDAEIKAALPLLLEDTLVGYLALDVPGGANTGLDEHANAFLTQLRWALAIGAGVAFVVGLVIAGLLTRSIVSPLRALTRTAETISQGRFDVRAEVRGADEIARLSTTFNAMAANLERAEQARQSQTADIAHELRNPLAVLQSSLEALADGIYAPTPENIDPALDQVQLLNRLVEDLRTLALADAGRLSLELQPVDINVLLARVAEGYRDGFRANGVALTLEPADSLPVTMVDYARLSQVVNNVLTNAIRYVPAGCTVWVKSFPEDEGVTVRVIDNGPGVQADQLPYLFDRFWRGEPSRSRHTGGSGLGLAIAYQVLEAHGGRIWAELTEGGGLTVSFWLPAA